MSTRRSVKLSPTRQVIKCVLAHEHILLRQGLRRMLEDEPDIDVAGEAGNAMECIQQIFEHAPDVVIADAKTLELSAAEAQLLIDRESPGTKLVFLDTDQKKNSSSVRSAEMERSADKQTSMEELIEMVRHACGLSADTPEMMELKRRSAGQTEARVLTPREQEVLTLLAEGKTVHAAATDLGLSSKTVDAHKFNLMRKLGIRNQKELVRYALERDNLPEEM